MAPSSQGSADLTSDSNERGTRSSGNASPTPTDEPSSARTGLMSPATRTLKKYQPLLKLTPAQLEESISLYETGWSCAALGKKYGVSRQSMWDLLRRRIQIRDRVESLPRKPTTAIQEKRHRTLRRYRKRAARITRAQMRAVRDRDKACRACGGEGTDIDHVKPVSQGGQTTMENLQLLCRPCHHEKSRRDRKGVA